MNINRTRLLVLLALIGLGWLMAFACRAATMQSVNSTNELVLLNPLTISSNTFTVTEGTIGDGTASIWTFVKGSAAAADANHLIPILNPTAGRFVRNNPPGGAGGGLWTDLGMGIAPTGFTNNFMIDTNGTIYFGPGHTNYISRPGDAFKFGMDGAQVAWLDGNGAFWGYRETANTNLGTFNAGFGTFALESLMTGSYNSALGVSALIGLTNGQQNAAVGYEAGRFITSGSHNTMMGSGAYAGTEGTYNTAIGRGSMILANTGSSNTMVGAYSGDSIGAGSGNVGVGYESGPNTQALTNTIAIGYSVKPTTDNEIRIGNSANTKAIFPITTYTGTGINFLKDDGTYGPATGGTNIFNTLPGTVINTVAVSGLLSVDANKTNGIAATLAHLTNAAGIFTGDPTYFWGADGGMHQIQFTNTYITNLTVQSNITVRGRAIFYDIVNITTNLYITTNTYVINNGGTNQAGLWISTNGFLQPVDYTIQPMITMGLAIGEHAKAFWGGNLVGATLVQYNDIDLGDSPFWEIHSEAKSVATGTNALFRAFYDGSQSLMELRNNGLKFQVHEDGSAFETVWTTPGVGTAGIFDPLAADGSPVLIFGSDATHTTGDLVQFQNNKTNQITFGPLAQVGFGAGGTNVLYRSANNLVYTNLNAFGTFYGISSDGANYAYYGVNGNVAKITGPAALYMQATAASDYAVLTASALAPSPTGTLSLGTTSSAWNTASITNSAAGGTNYIYFGTNTLSVTGITPYWNQTSMLGGGGTINPTDGYVPYRINSTTFGDSPWFRINTNQLGFNSTNFFLTSDSHANLAVGDYTATFMDGTGGAIGNTSIGSAAGYKLTLGDSNTMIGQGSGYYNETGSRNVFIGTQAGSSGSASDNILIGWAVSHDTVGITNTIVIANSVDGANGPKATNSNEAIIGNARSTYIFPGTSMTFGGSTITSWPTGGSGGGNMTNTGASVVGMVPVATDTTGTQWTPTNSLSLNQANVGTFFLSNMVANVAPVFDGDTNLVPSTTTTNDLLSLHNMFTATGATVAGPILTTTPTTNGPSTLELATAGWVRSLLANGSLLYNSTNVVGTAFDASTYLYVGSEPTNGSRSYTPAAGDYIGTVMTTNRYEQVSGPVHITTYFTSTGGAASAQYTLHPEIYYTYDTNSAVLYGDYASAPQAITHGALTNQYDFVISFPPIINTNGPGNGFYLVRRFKIDTKTGTDTLKLSLGTNGVNNTSSHIAFSTPAIAGANWEASGTTNAILRGNATLNGLTTTNTPSYALTTTWTAHSSGTNYVVDVNIPSLHFLMTTNINILHSTNGTANFTAGFSKTTSHKVINNSGTNFSISWPATWHTVGSTASGFTLTNGDWCVVGVNFVGISTDQTNNWIGISYKQF